MKVTVIYPDKFISVDGKGMYFAENWPFEETDIHAIQWHGDKGELEYNTPIPNKELSDKSEIKKYVDLFTEGYQKWMKEQEILAEIEKEKLMTWEDAMKELELQLDVMQKNHEFELEQMLREQDKHLDGVKEEFELQVEQIYNKVQENQLNLYYAENAIEDESKEKSYDSMTIFDSNIDPSLFDDSVDPTEYDAEEETDEEESGIDETSNIQDFKNFDLSLLEDEFNLEMLFEDEDSPIVNEIEELIEQEHQVDAAQIPDN
jgi:uncharacterized membrane protein YqiK